MQGVTSGVSLQVSTVRPERRLLRVFADPRRSIVGPASDLLWIYGSPVWALIAVHALLHVSVLNRDVNIGEPTTIVAFVMASITFAHLLPVFVRSHLNGTIRRTYRRRVLLVPPVLVIALAVWPAALIVAGVVAAFWDVYHTAQQNFGLGRIYDARAGVAREETRRADRLISHVLYLGPILAGPSLMDHIGELRSLDQVGWSTLARTPDSVSPRAALLRAVVITVMVMAVGAYLLFAVRLARRGIRSSPHKIALMVVSAVIQILAWGFSSPLVAFMVVNLYHAVQYFALVWHIEGRKAGGEIGLRKRNLAVPFGVLVVFILPALFGAAESGIVSGSAIITAAFLSVSLLHFWMDGFIWSVRTNSV